MISLIANITDKAKEFIRNDEVEGVIEIKSRYAGLDSIILPVPKDEDATDDIFTMSKLNMHNISFLQYSILYGAKKCFNYFINIVDKDHIDSGSHSLHIATTRLDIYYIDQLLKKWGDNDIWINIRDTRNGYTGLMNVLVHDDDEFTSPFFNEAERTIEEVQDLKIKITEIFTSYPTLNVLLEDTCRTVIFDVLVNTPSDNIIKNILITHKSMGELQNIGLRVSERRARGPRNFNSSSFITHRMLPFPRLRNWDILRNDTGLTEGELEERDIELVMTQARVNREEATSALTDANGDIVNAIMSFT